MPAYLYILYSPSKDRFYIGHTADALTERLRRHNSNHKGFTGKVADWNMVYQETYQNKNAAYERERQLKAWKSRKKIQQLIEGSARAE